MPTLGSVKSVDEAKEIQKKAKENGFTDAFVIAFEDGVKINLFQATNKLKLISDE